MATRARTLPTDTQVYSDRGSLVVQVPDGAHLADGTKVRVWIEDGRMIVVPVDQLIDLTGIAGSMPWLQPLTDEERTFEERELDWNLTRLPRG